MLAPATTFFHIDLSRKQPTNTASAMIRKKNKNRYCRQPQNNKTQRRQSKISEDAGVTNAATEKGTDTYTYTHACTYNHTRTLHRSSYAYSCTRITIRNSRANKPKNAR